MAYDVKDINLAGEGKLKIEWAETHMPVLMKIRRGFEETKTMKAVLKKQLDEMGENELKYLLRRDYLRKLTRYRITDDFYRKKYNMDFEVIDLIEILDKLDIDINKKNF